MPRRRESLELAVQEIDFDFSRKKDEAAYRLLDEATEYGLADKNAVFFELLSIGQAFAQSAAASELRRLLAQFDS